MELYFNREEYNKMNIFNSLKNGYVNSLRVSKMSIHKIIELISNDEIKSLTDEVKNIKV